MTSTIRPLPPPPNHYCCYHCYIPTTASTRHGNTVELFPKYFNFPNVTNSTYLCQSADYIISILSNKHTPYSYPSLSFGSPILYVYLQVAQILLCSAQTPPPTPLHTPPIHGKLTLSVPPTSEGALNTSVPNSTHLPQSTTPRCCNCCRSNQHDHRGKILPPNSPTRP